MSTSLYPFLEMNGNASEAIDFYVTALDAKVVFMLRFADLPGNKGTELPPEKQNWITYASLKIGEAELTLSDDVTGSNYHTGTQVTIVVQTPDKNKAKQYFEALQEGGKVNVPLQPSFFSSAYGNVTDKFGVTFRVLLKGQQ
ncbi:MAG: VOC family protein [Paenibacillaceae bacterium]